MPRTPTRFLAIVSLLLAVQMFVVAPYANAVHESKGGDSSLFCQLHPPCLTSINPTTFEGKPEKSDRKGTNHRSGGLLALCQRTWGWPPVAAAQGRQTSVLHLARSPALWLLKRALLI